MNRRAFSISEFCSLYAVGRTKAYAEISSGRLRAVKVGRRTNVRRHLIKKFKMLHIFDTIIDETAVARVKVAKLQTTAAGVFALFNRVASV
jgi:excisionase family DNA binding protein